MSPSKEKDPAVEQMLADMWNQSGPKLAAERAVIERVRQWYQTRTQVDGDEVLKVFGAFLREEKKLHAINVENCLPATDSRRAAKKAK